MTAVENISGDNKNCHMQKCNKKYQWSFQCKLLPHRFIATLGKAFALRLGSKPVQQRLVEDAPEVGQKNIEM